MKTRKLAGVACPLLIPSLSVLRILSVAFPPGVQTCVLPVICALKVHSDNQTSCWQWYKCSVLTHLRGLVKRIDTKWLFCVFLACKKWPIWCPMINTGQQENIFPENTRFYKISTGQSGTGPSLCICCGMIWQQWLASNLSKIATKHLQIAHNVLPEKVQFNINLV